MAGGEGTSERAITGIIISLIQWKENNPMEGTGVCVTRTYCASLCADLADSCLGMFLRFLLSQVSTAQVKHQGSPVTRLMGSASCVPVVHVVLLSHDERSHTPRWSFLALGNGRGEVPHRRDRADEVSSVCLFALCDGEHDPCSPRFPDIMM